MLHVRISGSLLDDVEETVRIDRFAATTTSMASRSRLILPSRLPGDQRIAVRRLCPKYRTVVDVIFGERLLWSFDVDIDVLERETWVKRAVEEA